MPKPVVLLSIPGLRSRDLGTLPRLLELSKKGVSQPLRPTAVPLACPAQASLITGVRPDQHGIVADALYSRDHGVIETWPQWTSSRIAAAPLWETLRKSDPKLTSAAWFPLVSRGLSADFICTPAPGPHAEQSGTPSCFTTPDNLYQTLREALGPFPLQYFQGADANIRSAAWIVDSFVQTAYVVRPQFSWVSLPHVADAARKFGPDSSEALHALGELDMAMGALIDGLAAGGLRDVAWLVATEYCVTPVSSVGRPNRVLREAGLLTPVLREGREQLAPRETPTFAVVNEQVAHVYVRAAKDIPRAVEALRAHPAVAEVLVGEERSTVGLNHPRSGDIVVIAQPDACLADDGWSSDWQAPDASSLPKGSHGQFATEAARDGLLVCSEAAGCFSGKDNGVREIDVAGFIRNLLGSN